MSLQDVALVSWGLKPLRVMLLIICQILGERCLAGCNVFFPPSFVCLTQPLLGCRCLSLFLLIYRVSAIYSLLAFHACFSSPPSIPHPNSFRMEEHWSAPLLFKHPLSVYETLHLYLTYVVQ